MLKIKDSVDLKELEKFGFEYVYTGDDSYWFKETSLSEIDKIKYKKLKKNGFARIVVSEEGYIYISLVFEYVYKIKAVGSADKEYYIKDLIEKGLVEELWQQMKCLKS